MATPTPRPLPGGRWTVVRFPQGQQRELVAQLVADWVRRAEADRPPKARWVALLGEFFMNEGAPVLLLSPQLPRAFFTELGEFFELLGPVTITRSRREDLGFRGVVLFRREEGEGRG